MKYRIITLIAAISLASTFLSEKQFGYCLGIVFFSFMIFEVIQKVEETEIETKKLMKSKEI